MREPASPSLLPVSAPAVLRPLHMDVSGSPMRGSNGVSRVLSLNSSPGISEGLSGLSLQYDASPRRASGSADAATTVQKWRIHFAKPPSSATAFALPKPVTTATLVQNLELDEDTVSGFFFGARRLNIFLIQLSSGYRRRSETFYRGVRSSKRCTDRTSP
jgi:hypothetical protein